MTNSGNNSFEGLPASLIREIFNMSGKIAEEMYAPFREINDNRPKLRKQMEENNLIRTNRPGSEEILPACCAIHGYNSYEKFLASHFACSAAFCVEGIVPPSGKTYFENPAHKAVFHAVPQYPGTKKILHAVMMEMEVELAVNAPHDIVFLNGSYITLFRVFMKTLKHALETKESIVSKEFLNRVKLSVMAFKHIFTSKESGKIWAGIPKTSEKRELSEQLNLPPKYDENTLFTILLSPGEFTAPIPVEQSELKEIKSIPIKDESFSSIRDSIVAAIGGLNVVHYRPHNWTRALRLEIDPSVSNDPSRLKMLLDTIKFQCGSPGICEPYPILRAENLAAGMKKAIPSMRKMAASQIASLKKDDLGGIFSLITGDEKSYD